MSVLVLYHALIEETFQIQKIREFCEINLQIGKSNNLREINFRDQTYRKQNPRNKLPWIFILGYPFENRDVEKQGLILLYELWDTAIYEQPSFQDFKAKIGSKNQATC